MRVGNTPDQPADQIPLRLLVPLQLRLPLTHSHISHSILLLNHHHDLLRADAVHAHLHHTHAIHHLHRNNELPLTPPQFDYPSLLLLRGHAPLVIATHLHHTLVDHRRRRRGNDHAAWHARCQQTRQRRHGSLQTQRQQTKHGSKLPMTQTKHNHRRDKRSGFFGPLLLLLVHRLCGRRRDGRRGHSPLDLQVVAKVPRVPCDLLIIGSHSACLCERNACRRLGRQNA